MVTRVVLTGLLAVLALAAPAQAQLLRDGGVRDARRFAGGRAGTVAWAVMGEDGRIYGSHVNQRFPSASVSKAMLLVAALRAARGRSLSGAERAALHPMITRSDNAAAWTVYRRLGGGPAVTRVAEAAGMTRFREVGYWSDEQITAADQVRLFFRLDRLVPARHRAYARHLLGGVVPEQRWGVPPAAEAARMRVLFKGGWRSSLTHQVARLERHGEHVAVAVMTTGSPSMAYAEQTIEGVARRLLSRRDAVLRGALDGDVG